MRKVYVSFVVVGVAATMALIYTLVSTTSPTLASSGAPAASDSPTSSKHAARAAEAPPTSANEDAAIAARIASVIKPKVFGSNFSINVVDAANHQTVFAENANTPRLPASNMKLVTAFNALRTLGPQARVTTKVVSLGGGHIAIVGGGDPTLSEAALDGLAARARAAVLANRLGASACGAKPANECRSVVHVHFVDSLFGPANRADGWPRGYIPSVASNVTSLGVLGDYSPTPALDAAHLFTDAMNSKLLKAKFDAGPVSGSGNEIAAQASEPVSTQVATMLLESENNVAEVLFRRVAIASGHSPDWTGGIEAATSLLQEAGIPLDGVSVHDGSGLSRQDRVTATFFTSLLAKMVERSTDPELASIYYGGGLPVAGQTGTLGSRFESKFSKCAVGRVHAKTGTLHDVFSLSGVANGTDGRPRLFSVIINSAPEDQSQDDIRSAIDRVVTTMTGCR